MPTFTDFDDEGEAVKRYCNHMQYGTVVALDADLVRALRRACAMDVEELTALQKGLAKERDYDGARIISGFVKDLQRQVKACSVILDNWFAEAWPKHVPLKLYPVDLMAELDRAFGLIAHPEDGTE
jgi:hypothetical protein